ncbi:MAG: GreA/GreB family elongation factor [Devosia sp.]
MGLFWSGLPPIIIGRAERHDLLVLAMGGTGHSADASDDLLYELGRADVVSDARLPDDAIRMGSVAAVSVDGERRILRLSYPAGVGADGISIFSPVGTALLGLRSGQVMRWIDRSGQTRDVQVHAVRNSPR